MSMWIDETDLTHLAQRLRLGPRELIEAIGGPWRTALQSPEQEVSAPGTLYIGRAGPAVAILVAEPESTVTVGRTEGHWLGITTLAWALTNPVESLVVPPPDSPPGDVDDFVARLGSVVEQAFADARPNLVLCRYCGVLSAAALCVGDELCSACGSRIFGIAR